MEQRRKLIDFSPRDPALVLTDPQNDFLSSDGAPWQLVGESIQGHHRAPE